uniref:Adhesion G protein-coupled receptor F3 n=1 Tax=Pipistrellus kuhlii TaxID=59472 RepID=A0A7J7VTQ7_PIPKU|nr:adhesion G protein-coupled receptor F3 [Pipistrellus kuhlii]
MERAGLGILVKGEPSSAHHACLSSSLHWLASILVSGGERGGERSLPKGLCPSPVAKGSDGGPQPLPF